MSIFFHITCFATPVANLDMHPIRRIATLDDTPNPFADDVRSYALDAGKAKQLWAKSEELISAAS
jgi:hypothetical protein